MNVRELRRGEEERWDEYVHKCSASTPQHLASWKQVMEEVFNSQTHYFYLEDHGQITAILPLIHIKNFVAGHYVTSFPGGLCADNEEYARELLAYIVEFVKAQNATYLILRDGRKKWDFPALSTDEQHVTILVDIPADLNQLKHTMKDRTRQLINKASTDSVEAKLGLEYLNQYYPVYARAMQSIGTPTLGLPFFESMRVHLPSVINLVSINYREQIVGGGYIATMGQMVYCLWSGLLREYYEKRISHLLYWEVIKYAHANNYSQVDLGRCRENSGGFVFKKSFGGHPQRLYQQFYLNGASQPPRVGAELGDDFKYRLFTFMWRRLPQPVSDVLGPKLRKLMPFG